MLRTPWSQGLGRVSGQRIVGARSCVQELLKRLQLTIRLAADEQLLVVSDSLGTSSTHAP